MTRAPRVPGSLEAAPPLALDVGPAEEGLRLEQFVRARIAGISRGSVLRLLRRGQVLVDGRRETAKGLRLRAGQQVLVAAAARDERPRAQPEQELELLAVWPELVAVVKRAGIPCHPLVPGETDTVANALVARFPECAGASPVAREAGLVHRLDAGTSGVLLAARTAEAYGRLRGLFSAGQVVKHYLALVAGLLATPTEVALPLRTAPGDPRRMEVTSGESREGRPAVTAVEPRERLDETTLVGCRTATGRRHQIRVHLAHLGHPLVGDPLYGGPSAVGGQQVRHPFLHASRVLIATLDLDLSAPLPPERRALLRALGARTA